MQAVAEFKDFNEENDPHREADFGSFDLSGREWGFKIDYYNLTMDAASDDPADNAKTKTHNDRRLGDGLVTNRPFRGPFLLEV